MADSISDSIIDLQSRIAYQEDMIGELNQQLVEQGEELAMLRQHIALLNKKLNDLMQNAEQEKSGAGRLIDERPPHY